MSAHFRRITTSIVALALAGAVTLVRAGESRPKPLFPETAPVCSCADLMKLSLPNTTIDSAVVDPSDGSCRVTATVTHPPAGDRVKVFIGLPMKGWNGRFRGTGGGGFVGGHPNSLRGPVSLGYAAGATDTGHEGGSASFALDANGRLNWPLIQDNAYLGIHEMTVLGKSLAQAFYGKAPGLLFCGQFNGRSSGFNGIATLPERLRWDRLRLPSDQLASIPSKRSLATGGDARRREFSAEGKTRRGHGRGGGGVRRFGWSNGRRH